MSSVDCKSMPCTNTCHSSQSIFFGQMIYRYISSKLYTLQLLFTKNVDHLNKNAKEDIDDFDREWSHSYRSYRFEKIQERLRDDIAFEEEKLTLKCRHLYDLLDDMIFAKLETHFETLWNEFISTKTPLRTEMYIDLRNRCTDIVKRLIYQQYPDYSHNSIYKLMQHDDIDDLVMQLTKPNTFSNIRRTQHVFLSSGHSQTNFDFFHTDHDGEYSDDKSSQSNSPERNTTSRA